MPRGVASNKTDLGMPLVYAPPTKDFALLDIPIRFPGGLGRFTVSQGNVEVLVDGLETIGIKKSELGAIMDKAISVPSTKRRSV
jgi:hypothetical protein